MNAADLRAALLAELRRMAPEIDPGTLDQERAVHDQVDLDSMDWLNFLMALQERFKVEIPEADYKRLGTLDEIVSYLSSRLGVRS